MRLIDADALWMDIIHSMDYCDDILEIIERQLSIEERKTGRWIGDNCSECGQYVYHGDARNFCPNCGARMEAPE